MKILQVIANARMGGMPEHVLTLSMELMRRGHEIQVLSLSEGSMINEFQKAGIRITSSSFLGNKMTWSPLLLRKATYFTRVLIREAKPDVIHTHGPRAHLIGGRASGFTGSPPLVATMHGSFRQFIAGNEGEFGWHRRWLKKYQYVLIDRFAGRVSNRLIAVCEATRRDLVEVANVPADKVLVIHNGIADLQVSSEERSAVRAGLGLKKSHKIVAYVGRVAYHKGVSDLIKAATDVVRQIPEARVLIVGEGPLSRDLKDHVVSVGLADKIIFTGPRSDAVQIIAASDLYVLPSLSEGLSLTLLEAAMTGTAMVVTDVGGNCEVVKPERNGLLITARNPEDLAGAINELLFDNERRLRMSKEARRLWQREFTAEIMTDKTEELYEEL